jgi:hypothetical protein
MSNAIMVYEWLTPLQIPTGLVPAGRLFPDWKRGQRILWALAGGAGPESACADG